MGEYLKLCMNLLERGYLVDLNRDGDRVVIKVFRDSVNCTLWIEQFYRVHDPYSEICRRINTGVDLIERYIRREKYAY